MVLPAQSPHDIDNLLSRYRTARAQQALFDVRGGAGTGYDEFVDAAGNIRSAWRELADCVGERGRTGLNHLRSATTASPTSTSTAMATPSRTGTARRNRDHGAWTRCRW